MENIIKMRLAMKDSPEGDWIQEAWVPKGGDGTDKGLITAISIRGHIGTVLNNYGYHTCKIDKYLWLPSVEDYLGMVDWEDDLSCENLTAIGDVLSYSYDYFKQFKTWPELMLAFVQHEIKSLSWDGEGWR